MNEPVSSEILNDKNKYRLTILRMNKKANKGVLFYLIIKVSIYNYLIIHILFIIISSMGILILSNDFSPDYSKYKYLSNWIRLITPYSIVKALKISHLTYIIICSVIIILCIIRNLRLLKLMLNTKNYDIFESNEIRMNNLVILMNHIVYIFFSYIIEFLSFIYYIEIIPDNFIIKKDKNINEAINILFCVLNGLFVIIYNINNFLYLSIINRPTSAQSYPMRIRLPKSKLILFIFFQNFSLIHPIQIYLDIQATQIWCIIFNIFCLLLFIYLYLISLKMYNYDNICNSIISFIGEFCFVSVIIEFILFFFVIKFENNKILFLFSLLKIFISLCLFFFLKQIYLKLLLKIARKRLFYNNPLSLSCDNNLITSILFIREIIKEKNYSQLNLIIEFFIDHKRQCINNSCGCRIINININNKISDKYDDEDILIKKINYYIETIMIKYNYQNNFDLSILLSQHFFLFKGNAKIAYSILQTLLHYNYKTLSREKLILLYESMNKYINHILIEKEKENIYNKNFKKNSKKLNKEMEMKQYLYLMVKIKKSIKYMAYYCKKFISVIKYKDNYENSNIVKFNEIINEIKYISSPFLNKQNLKQIIDYLSSDEIFTSYIKKYLYELKEFNYKLLSYEFLYKVFLFIDFFWNGKIPNNLMEILYSFTSNRSIYNIMINPEIFQLLEYNYYESLNYNKKQHYLLLKYTKNLKISYISELLSHILKFNKSELINNELNSIIVKDMIPFHENVIKEYYIFYNNFMVKDKIKFIFDSQGYLLDMIMNSSIQIGLNKNILIICLLEINQENKDIYFYANKNLDIISINRSFNDNLFLSLNLIEEFKIEIKDLFEVNIHQIHKIYKNEISQLKLIREYKAMNTSEYVIKNLYKYSSQNNNFHINNKLINDDNDNSNNSDNESNEKDKFINENERNKNLKFVNNLYNNLLPNKIHFFPIKYKINKEDYILNIRKIIERIKGYERDKLENKNIYNDYLKLINNYNQIYNNQNVFFTLCIEPRVLDDTPFYFCEVKQFMIQNISGIESITPYHNINIQNETDDMNFSLNSNSPKKKVNELTKQKSNISVIYKNCFKLNEETRNEDYIANKPYKYYKEKIKINKISKYKLFFMLLICSCVLLVSSITTLIFQTNLVHKNDKIFDALYYNYYQRTQFNYLNSIILSIYYELTNISNFNLLEENKYMLKLIGKNIEDSHQLFFSYYMDFKIELDEDFSKLYEPLLSNKITINWENRIFHNDYNTELALIVFRIFDSIRHDFDNNDVKDCEIFLFGKFLNIDRKRTPVNGNFIKLIYFFYANYDTILYDFFINLEDSYDISLNDFSQRTTSIYIILEIIGIISFHAFFFVNFFFLLNYNKYIFRNILYMFLDFTQTDDYTFNNKTDNLLAIKRMSNYIILLNEFNPKNLNSLKYNKENRNITDLKYLVDEDINDYSISIYDSKNKSKNGKKVNRSNKQIFKVNRKGSSEKIVNTSLLKYHNNHNTIIGEINNNNLSKNDKIINNNNNYIHVLNNDNLNNISNNSLLNLNNSKNNSTDLFLNTSNEYDNKKSKNNDGLKLNKENEENLKITFEIILFQTRITMLYSIKIIIIIFILFILIFIFYYIYKLILSLLFISNFKEMINDFKQLTLQYNRIILYWSKIETLFILPNSSIKYNLNETETYFYELNNKVYEIYYTRIKRYKKISALYNILLSKSSEKNLSNIDFCLGHTLCNNIKKSNQFLLSNGIESTVNMYSKEIYNYYNIYQLLKNNITELEDIQYLFSDERFKILSINLNHIFIFLEEKFFKYFLEDEKKNVDNFYLTIKVINIIEICYCLLLNLFSVLFIYPYIMKIVSSVENASSRINCSLCRMKIYI